MSRGVRSQPAQRVQLDAEQFSVLVLLGNKPAGPLDLPGALALLRQEPAQLTERQDEMIFFREIDHIQWKDIEQMGPIALDVYTQRCSSDPVHSREDVFEWQIIAEFRR